MDKTRALTHLKEQARFYISSPEKAGDALLFVKELKKFTEEIEKKVKERATEILDRDNVEYLEYKAIDNDGNERTFEMRRAYGTTSKEYRPENVLRALDDQALPFLKVSKTALDTYLKNESRKGSITMEQVELATKDPKEKPRKGAGVIMKETIKKIEPKF